ncbi:MAG: zinc-ribbon domain-containing protein [Ardenticatenaceae bacterium]|nr:zinc-ribbon domain-containing protein [Ardenticatenaceae bacterium]
MAPNARVVADDGASKQTTTCRYCGDLVQMEPVRNKRYFSLFFVPIFPAGERGSGVALPQLQKTVPASRVNNPQISQISQIF